MMTTAAPDPAAGGKGVLPRLGFCCVPNRLLLLLLLLGLAVLSFGGATTTGDEDIRTHHGNARQGDNIGLPADKFRFGFIRGSHDVGARTLVARTPGSDTASSEQPMTAHRLLKGLDIAQGEMND